MNRVARGSSLPPAPTPPNIRITYPAVRLVKTDTDKTMRLLGLGERNATGISASAAQWRQQKTEGSPIKGLVKRKNTSPIEKYTCFSFHTFVVAGFGIALLITLFRTRYFYLWFAWSLTRISHPSGSRRLCWLSCTLPLVPEDPRKPSVPCRFH